VAQLKEVKAARCLSCLSCVDACPRDSKGAIFWGPPNRLGRSWPQAALIAILLVCLAGAVATVYAFPMPSFVRVTDDRGEVPARTATIELGVHNLTCRGSATLCSYFLERDDEFEVPGYLKLEAWPGPGAARARITFDPSQTDEEAIKEALTEPYYDATGDVWRPSPFQIEGYDPLGLFDETNQP
jgi:ferredoxin